MHPIVLYYQPKIGKILRALLEKRPKKRLFGLLIPYNPGLRIFSIRPSRSNGGSYYPLHSCKIWDEAKESQNTFFGHIMPYNPGLRFFQKNYLARTMGPIVLYTNAKNWEDP